MLIRDGCFYAANVVHRDMNTTICENLLKCTAPCPHVVLKIDTLYVFKVINFGFGLPNAGFNDCCVFKSTIFFKCSSHNLKQLYSCCIVCNGVALFRPAFVLGRHLLVATANNIFI